MHVLKLHTAQIGLEAYTYLVRHRHLVFTVCSYLVLFTVQFNK